MHANLGSKIEKSLGIRPDTAWKTIGIPLFVRDKLKKTKKSY